MMLERGFRVFDKETGEDVTSNQSWYTGPDGTLYCETDDIDMPCQEADMERYTLEQYIKHDDTIYIYRDNVPGPFEDKELEELARKYQVRHIVAYHNDKGLQWKQSFALTFEGKLVYN